jgi:hypothetical protein
MATRYPVLVSTLLIVLGIMLPLLDSSTVLLLPRARIFLDSQRRQACDRCHTTGLRLVRVIAWYASPYW